LTTRRQLRLIINAAGFRTPNLQLTAEGLRRGAPNLASKLHENRIIYLGMPLFPQVGELMVAQLIHMMYDDCYKPIEIYINCTGTAKQSGVLGNEYTAFGIYDVMRNNRGGIYPTCLGSAWGEAALILAGGTKGQRRSLPSGSIMIRQPIQRATQLQASDLDNIRKELRSQKSIMAELLAENTGHSLEKVIKDIERPKYFSPQTAIDYGIIDKISDPMAVRLERLFANKEKMADVENLKAVKAGTMTVKMAQALNKRKRMEAEKQKKTEQEKLASGEAGSEKAE